MRNFPLLRDFGLRPNELASAWRSRAALWCVGLVGVLSCGAWADSPQKSVDPAQIADLVTRLRAPSFRERLQAEADCRETGPAVLPALVEALQSPDPELRRRAQALIEQIEVDGLDDAIEAFLAPGSRVSLPGWPIVADLVEDAPEFRSAYAEVLRGNTQLARALAYPQLIPLELQRQLQHFGTAGGIGAQGLSTAQTSAILLLLIHPEAAHTEDWAANGTFRSMSQPAKRGVNETAAGQLLQALVTRWVVTPQAGAAYDRLSAAMGLSLPEAVTPALEMLRQKTSPHQLQAAFLAILRYGGAAEMSVVETLLDDTFELNSNRGPDNSKTTSTQLRDLALATLIEMNKQDPTTFGLRALSRDPSGNVIGIAASFDSDAQREAAFEKWRTWSGKNLRKYWAPPAHAEEGTGL